MLLCIYHIWSCDVIVYISGVELLKQQMTKEDLDCLPTVHVSDIQPEAERVTTQTTSVRKYVR